jgi:hypothetical protein
MRTQNQLGAKAMSTEHKQTLLTISALFFSIIVAILLHVAGLINWTLIAPMVFVLCGLWMLAIGAMRMDKSERYERSGFSTLALGLVAIAVGGAWFAFTINWLYSLVVILLALAVLGIATALQHK